MNFGLALMNFNVNDDKIHFQTTDWIWYYILNRKYLLNMCFNFHILSLLEMQWMDPWKKQSWTIWITFHYLLVNNVLYEFNMHTHTSTNLIQWTSIYQKQPHYIVENNRISIDSHQIRHYVYLFWNAPLTDRVLKHNCISFSSFITKS